jgi:hypothetical protein
MVFIYSLKSSLKLNMCQELHILAFVYIYLDASCLIIIIIIIIIIYITLHYNKRYMVFTLLSKSVFFWNLINSEAKYKKHVEYYDTRYIRTACPLAARAGTTKNGLQVSWGP